MLQTDSYECPEYLLQLAADLPPTPTALVGAHASLPLESAKLGFEKGLITPVLVGEEVTIRKTANRIDWDISKLRVVDTTSETETSDTAAALARDGCVTALMKGQIHTDNFMLGILKKEFGASDGSPSHAYFSYDHTRQ